LGNINNPVVLGNPNLDPETIQTLELAFDYRPVDRLRLGLNLFGYQWDDIIRFVFDPETTTRTAQNTGEQIGYGLELEADWQPTRSFRLLGNYSYQRSIDEATDEDAGNAPHHQVYLRADWEFLLDWHFNPQLNWIIDRDRVAGDNRPDIDDYSLVDLTVRRKNIKDHWEIAFAVRNLFDSDAREPSPAMPVLIPDDLPLAGRSFFGEIRFRF
jgi:outer membrane receptor protein involved in Fe transport